MKKLEFCAIKMKILLLDNNDSFVYNLYHLIKSAMPANAELEIKTTENVDAAHIAEYSHVVLSPGPGLPCEFPKLNEAIKNCAMLNIPLLGVCLGHQAIADAFGGSLSNLQKPLHGVQSNITISKRNELFNDLPDVLKVGRYHSWIVSSEDLPQCFEITSVDSQNIIMSISHKEYNIHGVQFHPESYMTDCGKKLISNFLNLPKR